MIYVYPVGPVGPEAAKHPPLSTRSCRDESRFEIIIVVAVVVALLNQCCCVVVVLRTSTFIVFIFMMYHTNCYKFIFMFF